MRNFLILLGLSCLLNGSTLLQETVSVLVDETTLLKSEISVLKERIKILEDSIKNKADKNITKEFSLVKRENNSKFYLSLKKRNTLSVYPKEAIRENKKIAEDKNNSSVIMISAWHANVRREPDKKSLIIGVYHIGSLHKIDATFKNENWYKLMSGGYLSKKVAYDVNRDSFKKVIVIKDEVNLRTYPFLKKEFLRATLKKGTVLTVYPKKVGDAWYVTKEHNFIYSNLVKSFK